VFGVGVQEMVLIGLLFLVIFGPSKLPQMAQDLGGFVNEDRRSVEEFKEEIMIEEDNDQEPSNGRKPGEGQGRREREKVSAVERSDRRTE
jgi:sec-independent protein translocase protein TatB